MVWAHTYSHKSMSTRQVWKWRQRQRQVKSSPGASVAVNICARDLDILAHDLEARDLVHHTFTPAAISTTLPRRAAPGLALET